MAEHVSEESSIDQMADTYAANVMPEQGIESPAGEKRKIGLIQGPWRERLDFVTRMMRELSSQTDPQEMVQTYARRMREVSPSDGTISLSRRGLQRPRVRITRSHTWEKDVDPWKARDRTFLDGGILSDLIWNNEATIIDDLQVNPNDPSEPYLRGMKSLSAIPLYDQGEALNMVVMLCRGRAGFDEEALPERVWMGNLFGRATHNLVLSAELATAYEAVDRELKIVADMQRSLLPRQFPEVAGLKIASHYQTSRRAGGDYYDFFELPNGQWGILIADVSGHGTPAAVIMAVTHSIAHAHHGPPAPPSRLMQHINQHLTERYTNGTGTFVTAFYGVYDPVLRQLTYSCAGHCPPRVKRARANDSADQPAALESLDGALALPLGIDGNEIYIEATATFQPGDALILYTDGITEARGLASNELFGTDRLDDVLRSCTCNGDEVIRKTLAAVDAFTEHALPIDDQTLLVANIN